MSASSDSLLLWYKQPAPQWDHGLPIGNGRLGAVIAGHPAAEWLQLNEETLWAGQPDSGANPASKAAFPQVRQLLHDGEVEQAEALAKKAMLGDPVRIKSYEMLADLQMTFPGHETYADYRRDLTLADAIARVSYRTGGVRYEREHFASYPHQVMAVRIKADRADAIDFQLTASRPENFVTTVDGRDLLMTGTIDEGNGLSYVLGIRVLTAGQVEAIEGIDFVLDTHDVSLGYIDKKSNPEEHFEPRPTTPGLAISRTDEVVLLIAAATDYRGEDPMAVVQRHLNDAESAGYTRLRASHVSDYQHLFNRCSLTLGESRPYQDEPTDTRLARIQRGIDDPGLVEIYFQYARYLLIASSRPDREGHRGLVHDNRPASLPANLQGIWAQKIVNPWSADFHININMQMNYWPAEVTGLSECHLPVFDLLESLVEPGREVASVQYGCEGTVAHHLTNPWGRTAPTDGHCGIWPMGGAWCVLHAWEHYAYTGDEVFLRDRAWPLLRESCAFFLDYLEEDKDGQLLSGPSVSPENRFELPNGQIGQLCMGPTMDNQILRELFTRAIETGRKVDADKSLLKKYQHVLDHLPPDLIGRYGQLQEWRDDYPEPEPGHRHISQLFALHPGSQISPATKPELAEAARITLDRRLEHGGGHTGWSAAWIINFRARLRDGDRAKAMLDTLLRRATLPNLWDLHPPFQIDGNFGAAAGIAEMLMQSHDGQITLLPALPTSWPSGSVTGLRARGGISVDFTWKRGRIQTVSLRANHQVSLRLGFGTDQRVLGVRCGDQLVPTVIDDRGYSVIELAAEDPYRIDASD